MIWTCTSSTRRATRCTSSIRSTAPGRSCCSTWIRTPVAISITSTPSTSSGRKGWRRTAHTRIASTSYTVTVQVTGNPSQSYVGSFAATDPGDGDVFIGSTDGTAGVTVTTFTY